ncbi:hypothetical protein KBC03_06995 [Patescibacteria group bacterium]|nr:hypothetical protein [Patescibacteria group bacterium]
MPITYQIMQLPAEDFLFFIEQMLNPQTDGKKSIEFIYTLIKKIHTQYEKYISSITRQTPKLQLSIEEIAEQLAREFSFSSHEQNFIEDTLPRAKKIIEAAGYEISDKMLGRKIGNFVSFYVKRYSPSNLGDSQETWLTELEDAISQWASTKQELAAYGKLREEQKRHAFKTKDRVTKETKYVKPRFTLQNLEEAKQKLSNKTRKEIEDYIN